MHVLQAILSNEFTCRSYSGRNMYGETCLAVEVDSSVGAIVALIVSETTDENRDDLVEAMQELRTDAMGMGQVAYFPGIRYQSERPRQHLRFVDEDGGDPEVYDPDGPCR